MEVHPEKVKIKHFVADWVYGSLAKLSLVGQMLWRVLVCIIPFPVQLDKRFIYEF